MRRARVRLAIRDAFIEAVIYRLRIRRDTRVLGDQMGRVYERLRMLERQPALDADGCRRFARQHLRAFEKWRPADAPAGAPGRKANRAGSQRYKLAESRAVVIACLKAHAKLHAPEKPTAEQTHACLQVIWSEMLGQSRALRRKELDEITHARGTPAMATHLVYLATRGQRSTAEQRDDFRRGLSAVTLRRFAYL